MKKAITTTVLALLCTAVGAQSFGAFSIAPIAATTASCPVGTANAATYCPVGSGTTYATYVSYNSGAYGPLGATGPAGPQGPAGPAGATGAQGPAGPTWTSCTFTESNVQEVAGGFTGTLTVSNCK